MYMASICTIGGNYYSVLKDVDQNKYVLCKNKEPIATIIRLEYDNWNGHQIRFRSFSLPAELDLDVEGMIALEDSIAYLNEYFGV